MAEGKNLKATSDAAEAVSSLVTNNHGAPSREELAQVSSLKEWPAAAYSDSLGSIGGELGAEFQPLLDRVLADCRSSERSIHEMQDLDAEIAGVLNTFAAEPAKSTSSMGTNADSAW